MTKTDDAEIDLCELRQKILEKFERINVATPERVNPLIKEMLREQKLQCQEAIDFPIDPALPTKTRAADDGDGSVSSAFSIDFVLLS